MRSALIWIMAFALMIGGLWFFYLSSEFLRDRDYLGGILHVFVGLAMTRSSVELARLAVALRMEGSG